MCLPIICSPSGKRPWCGFTALPTACQHRFSPITEGRNPACRVNCAIGAAMLWPAEADGHLRPGSKVAGKQGHVAGLRRPRGPDSCCQRHATSIEKAERLALPPGEFMASSVLSGRTAQGQGHRCGLCSRHSGSIRHRRDSARFRRGIIGDGPATLPERRHFLRYQLRCCDGGHAATSSPPGRHQPDLSSSFRRSWVSAIVRSIPRSSRGTASFQGIASTIRPQLCEKRVTGPKSGRDLNDHHKGRIFLGRKSLAEVLTENQPEISVCRVSWGGHRPRARNIAVCQIPKPRSLRQRNLQGLAPAVILSRSRLQKVGRSI